MSSEHESNVKAIELSVIVPEDSGFDLDSFIETRKQGRDGEPPHTMSAVAQRDVLYFGRSCILRMPNSIILLIHRQSLDEFLPVYLILRTKYLEKSDLTSYLERLTINLDIVAYTPQTRLEYERTAPQQSSLSPSHDILWSSTVDTSQKPGIVLLDTHQIEAIWKINVLLSMWKNHTMLLATELILTRPSKSPFVISINLFPTVRVVEPVYYYYLGRPVLTERSSDFYQSVGIVKR